MPLIFNDSYQNNSPKPVDNKYGRFVSGAFRAYLNVGEANTIISSAYRYKGLTVLVGDGTNNLEYWYKAGIQDSDLVVKGNPGGGGGTFPQLSYYRPEDYGAIGDGTTNDSAAFNAAVAAMTDFGGVIYLGAKTYKIDQQVSLNKPVTVMGQGAGDVDGFGPGRTRIISSSPTANIFVTTAAGVTFEKFSMFNTATTPTAGSAIRIQSGGLGLRFRDIAINGFYDNMYFYDGGEWTMDGCQFMNNNRYNLYVSRQTNPDGGDMCISNTFFFTGGVAGIRYVSGGGLKVTNSKFNCSRGTVNGTFQEIVGQYAIDADIDQSTVDMIVSGCSLENFGVSGIKIRRGSSVFFNNVGLIGNQFAPRNSTQPTIDIDGVNNVVVLGNVMQHWGSEVAIKIANGNDIVVDSNTLAGFTGSPIVTSGLSNMKIQNGYGGAGGAFPFVGPPDVSGGAGKEIIVSNLSLANYSGKFSIYSGQTNGSIGLDIVPRGTGSTAGVAVYNSDYLADKNNVELLGINAGNDVYEIASAAFGTGVVRPISFKIGNSESLGLDAFGRTSIKNLIFQSVSPDSTFILSNLAWDGTNFIRKDIGYGSGMQFTGGATYFYSVDTSGGGGAVAVANIPLCVAGNQRVGVNTTTPQAALDVNGEIQSNAGLNLKKNGSASLGDGPFISLINAAGNGAMYIQLNATNGIDFWHFNGTDAPSVVMTLSNAGVLKVGTVSGNGTGMLVADNEGNVSKQAIPVTAAQYQAVLDRLTALESGPPTPSTLHNSTFTAADGTVLTAYTPETGSAWLHGSGTGVITNNKLVINAAGMVYFPVSQQNYTATVIMLALTNVVQIALRTNAAGTDNITINISKTDCQIYNVGNGSGLIATANLTEDANDHTWEITLNGTSITIKRDGATIHNAITVASHSGTNIGIVSALANDVKVDSVYIVSIV